VKKRFKNKKMRAVFHTQRAIFILPVYF